MRSKIWIAAASLAFVLSCSSDPEGPVSAKFVDDGTYGVGGGEIKRAIIPLRGATVTVPKGVGTGQFLILGRLKGIEYRALLLKFDFTVDAADAGKTVSSARLYFPMQVATPEDFTLPVTCHELLSTFADTSSIVEVPSYDPAPIPDSLGGTVRTLDLDRTEYDIDTSYVNGWLAGTREHRGIAVVWAAIPDTTTSLEMKALEYGSDAPAVRVTFTDGTSASYAVTDDYSVAVFGEPGLNCVGGLARRIAFGFERPDISERAMVSASFLVLTIRGGLGFGGAVGEQLVVGLSSDFYYYLYTPKSADTLSADFLAGTGVDQDVLYPTVSRTVKLPLRGFMADILDGTRANTGLVLQSNLEATRVQRICFASEGADAPYIELFYSLPADFGGSK